MDFDSREFRDLPWDRIVSVTAVVLLVAVVLYMANAAVYAVAPHEKAVVLRFGRYHKTVDPGLKFCIPLVDRVLKVSVEEHSLRLPFGEGPDRPQATAEEPSLMLTADLNASVVEWTIQWQVVRPEDFLFRLYRKNDDEYAQRVITMVAQTVMNQLVGDYSIDEVLTQQRGAIAEQAREQTQQQLDAFDCGIGITDLQMQRVAPPAKVRPSFDMVNASKPTRSATSCCRRPMPKRTRRSKRPRAMPSGAGPRPRARSEPCWPSTANTRKRPGKPANACIWKRWKRCSGRSSRR